MLPPLSHILKHLVSISNFTYSSFPKLKQNAPVMRLEGSNTSIFSARSKAVGEMSGNFSVNDCFLTRGSCFKYFLAFSLLKKSRSESSGEPMS